MVNDIAKIILSILSTKTLSYPMLLKTAEKRLASCGSLMCYELSMGNNCL